MLTTSTEYKNVVAQNSRHFLVKVEIENVVYTGIKGFKYKGGTNASDHVTFGDTVSTCVEFTLTDVSKNMILLGKRAKPYIGLQLSDSIEWIPLGVFVLEKPVKSDGYLKITAYDNFTLCQKGFFSDLKGQQSIGIILEEQCKKIGINYAGGDDGATYDVDGLQGFTIQEAVGYLSAYCGTNAIMDRNGDLKLVWYQNTTLTISNDRYASPIDMSEDDTYINRLNCVTDEKTQLTVGTGIGIDFTCPGMTQERLLVLYNRIKGFTYRAMKLTWKMAQPEILAGDTVTIVDKDGYSYKLPLMSIELSCDGGCFGTLQSKAKTQVQQDNPYKEPIQTKIDYTYTEAITTKKLVTETIEAWTGKFETIDTNYLNVNKKLTASEAEIEDLKSTSITTKVFEAELTKINQAIIGKLDVTEFTAVSGKVDIMEIGLNKVNTLLAGNITAGSTQTIVLNAENTTITNALIKSAMIDSVTANKITAGIIDASSIHFKSNTGNMDLYDNTILIKDATRGRVQIGKDASDDYNIYVWDKDGKLMFDATGVTADGIQRPIIRDDMVSPDANIDGGKINIVSLVTEINGSTTKIESSHVLYDGKSLDVAFNQMKTTVDGNTTTIGTLSTQLTMEQGKITTLISDTTQIKGNVNTLSTNYSTLQQTVNGLSTIVGNQTSSIINIDNVVQGVASEIKNVSDKQTTFETSLTAITGRISTDESNIINATNAMKDLTTTVSETATAISELKLDYSGFKTSVSDTYATKETLDVLGNKFSEYSTTTQVNTMIDQKTDEIKLTAEQSEVNQYYYQNGVGNLFSNCAQSLSGNNKSISDMVFIGDVAKLKGKDISISVNVAYRGFTGHFICGFSVTYTNRLTKRYEFELSPYAKLLPYKLGHGSPQSYSGRLSNTITLDNADISSVSNLDMQIVGSGEESRIWNPKAETGVPTGLTQALSGMNTKVEKASLAVSPQQILGTISSAIDGGKSISTVAMLLNKDGLTIYNGAFKVLNSGGDSVLYADLNGNLTLKGKVYATDGEFRGKIYADEGVFRGKIYATEGEFSGHITYAQIDGANINISQDARIGNNLYLGSATDKTTYRYISLNGGAIPVNGDNYGDCVYYRAGEVGLSSTAKCGMVVGGIGYGGGISIDVLSGQAEINLGAYKIYASVGITVSSDMRLKDKIADVDVSWIDELKVKTYVYKKDPLTSQIGLLAQDYIDKDYAKYFLEFDDGNGYYGISYGNITNALIQYCQQMNIRVKQLETVIKQRSDNNG